MLDANEPALVLAPMEGITDAPMRALQGATGAFSYAVSEFLRVSGSVLPAKVFRRDIPEFAAGGRTPTGMPVQIQLLGGDPERMAKSALAAIRAGAKAIDINFGCPAPTVNRHDGGASLLKCPARIREIVSVMRAAVPLEMPVSAKLRLGWDSIDQIDENAAMAVEGGAAWLTIHARTRTQGYQPPVYWEPIRRVREALPVPVVANGDIRSLEDFYRCRDATGCRHFMIGRGALIDPLLPYQVASVLGIGGRRVPERISWSTAMRELVCYTEYYHDKAHIGMLLKLKQWAKMAANLGSFPCFDVVKRADTVEEFFRLLEAHEGGPVVRLRAGLMGNNKLR